MATQAGAPAAARLPGGAATGPRHLWRYWLRRRVERRDIPAVAGLALAPGERLLTTEGEAQAVAVAGTDRAVYHRDRGGGWLRLGWEQVGRVDWDEPRRTLLLTGLTPDVPRRALLPVRRGSALPALARERVGWSTLLAGPIRLDRVGTLLTVRRQPGTDRLLWVVTFDAEVDRDDPATPRHLAAALARLRAETGI